MAPPLPSLFQSTVISVTEVLQYVVWRLGNVIYLVLTVPSNDISETRPRAGVLYNFVENIHVVGIAVGSLSSFLGVYHRSSFLFCRAFCLTAMVP